MSQVLYITEEYYYQQQIPMRCLRSIYYHHHYNSSRASSLDSTTPVTDDGQNKLIDNLWSFTIQLVVALIAPSLQSLPTTTSTPPPLLMKMLTLSTFISFCSTIASMVLFYRRHRSRLLKLVQAITYLSTTLAFTSLVSLVLGTRYWWIASTMSVSLLVCLFHDKFSWILHIVFPRKDPVVIAVEVPDHLEGDEESNIPRIMDGSGSRRLL